MIVGRRSGFAGNSALLLKSVLHQTTELPRNKRPPWVAPFPVAAIAGDQQALWKQARLSRDGENYTEQCDHRHEPDAVKSRNGLLATIAYGWAGSEYA